jgi:hypothetical protein
MRPTMKERKLVTKLVCEQYRKARKKEKSAILNVFVQETGYNRCYARWLLRNHGRRVEVKPGIVLEGDAGRRRRRCPQSTYGPEVLAPLKKLWAILDCASGKRLKAALPGLIERLEACREIRLTKAIRTKLLRISAATIDRLLKPERAKHTLKGRHHTKPGTLLKHQIPMRTFSEWDDARPGFMEMDLVGHDGGIIDGDHCFTLDVTDVDSGWTEQAAVRNKAQSGVFEALQHLRGRLPFAVLGLHSDNGGEFINDQLYRFCVAQKITFTRGRPYRKNDTCHVEEKNWSIVRRFVGYARYESDAACRLLNELYALLRDYTNFFFPSFKLKEKIRDGAHVLRHYHPALTPYQRLMQSPDVPQHVKDRLKAHYETLNPAALQRRIQTLQKKLGTLAAQTRHARSKTA